MIDCVFDPVLHSLRSALEDDNSSGSPGHKSVPSKAEISAVVESTFSIVTINGSLSQDPTVDVT